MSLRLTAAVAAVVAAAGSAAAQTAIPNGNAPGFAILRAKVTAGGPTPGMPNEPTAVMTAVPYQRLIRRQLYPGRPPANNPTYPIALQLDQKPGAAYSAPLLFADGSLVDLYMVRNRSPEGALRNEFAAWRMRQTFDGLYALVGRAIELGQYDAAGQLFARLDKLVKDHKEGVPPSDLVAAAARAYTEVGPRLDKPLAANPATSTWKFRLRAQAAVDSPHFTLLHFGDQFVSREAVDRRLDALERNYRAFYLAHAHLGWALPPPAAKSLVVLAGRSSDLPRLREAVDGRAVTADAFFAPEHGLLVLSPDRTDDPARAFTSYAAGQFRAGGWDRDALARGEAPPPARGDRRDKVDIARMMTLALIDRRLEADGDWAAVTHEGTRQLYSAAGVLPPHVHLPDWVDAGAVHLLAKPLGPAVTFPSGKEADPSAAVLTVGLVPGTAAPNYYWSRVYRDLREKKALHPDLGERLRNVVLDRYFDAARTGQEVDPPADPTAGRELSAVAPPPAAAPGGAAVDPAVAYRARLARLDDKAQATAWALVYYLAKTRPDGLARFYAELGRLPRDFDVDRRHVLGVFAQAFGIRTTDAGEVDDRSLSRFAEAWVRYMDGVNSPGLDIPRSEFQTDAEQGGATDPPGEPPGGPANGPGEFGG